MGKVKAAQRRQHFLFAATTIAATLICGSAAKSDVTIGQDWTPVPNQNGFTYYDGITNYSGNPLAQVDVNGNKWLQLDDSNPYWGQYTGQEWANSNLTTQNFNTNPRIEFDLNLSQWHFGNLDYKVEIGNDNGSGGTEGGQGSTAVGAHLGYLTVPYPSTTGNPIIQHISVDLSDLLPRNPTAAWLDFLQYLQPNYWGYWDPNYDNGNGTFGAWRDTGNNYTPQRVLIDNLRLTSDPAKINGSWNVDADGNWSDSGNWAGAEFGTGGNGLPNGAGHTANFSPDKHTYSTGNLRYEAGDPIGGHTITLDVPVTLGALNFYNTSSYTLAGANTLTITGATGVPAAITVAAGSHFINVPLAFSGDTTVDVRTSSSLAASNLQPTSGAVTKTGDGLLFVNRLRTGALNVNGGGVFVSAGRSTAKTSDVTGLTVASGAKLDLADNDMVVRYSGSSPISAIAGYIAGGAANDWSGNGLTSSAAAAAAASAHKTALGYAEASQVLTYSGGAANFSGVTLNQGANAVLVRYTLAGDGDLSGTVDLTDFTYLAANFNGGGKNWLQGDYNYDGNVDLTDFTFLASNFNQTLPSSSGLGAAVPEPAALSAIGMVGLSLLRRRNRVRIGG
jgi:hypothetical protein